MKKVREKAKKEKLKTMNNTRLGNNQPKIATNEEIITDSN